MRVTACVLLTWGTLCTSSTVHAQARPSAAEAPGDQYAHQDWLTLQDMDDANPCMRRDRLGIPNFRWGSAGIAICVGRIRSRAVSLARSKGLDEHGVLLESAARARKLAEMEIWLRRLPGNFQIGGTYTNSGGSDQARGTAECFRVGAGSGVSCVVAAKWKAPKQSLGKNPALDKALYSAMQPLVLLLGIDPDAMEIRATLFDFRAVPMRGVLVNGTAILERLSPPERLLVAAQLFVGEGNSRATYDWWAGRIAIGSSNDLDMKFLFTGGELDLQLHRLRKDGAP